MNRNPTPVARAFEAEIIGQRTGRDHVCDRRDFRAKSRDKAIVYSIFGERVGGGGKMDHRFLIKFSIIYIYIYI